MKIEEAIEWMEEAIQETTECFEQCSPTLQEELIKQKEVFELALTALRSMPTLIPPNEPEHAGLYGKYTVYKNKDGSLVTDCFILRPAKDPAAVAALRAYADATDNAELAADIINWVGAKPNEALTLEQLREMDGQPAWIVPVNDKDWEPHWAVMKHRRFFANSKTERGKMYFLYEDSYGDRWLAYAYSPARIDREAWKCDLCASEIDRFAQGCLGMRFCKRCGHPLTPRAWAELEKRLRG